MMWCKKNKLFLRSHRPSCWRRPQNNGSSFITPLRFRHFEDLDLCVCQMNTLQTNENKSPIKQRLIFSLFLSNPFNCWDTLLGNKKTGKIARWKTERSHTEKYFFYFKLSLTNDKHNQNIEKHWELSLKSVSFTFKKAELYFLVLISEIHQYYSQNIFQTVYQRN